MEKKYHQPCGLCGKETKRTTTQFCSPKHRAKWNRANGIRYGGPPRKLPNIICPICKNEFWRNQRNARFCSYRCAGLSRSEQCAELGRRQRGKKRSIETRERLSLAATKRNATRIYTKGFGGVRKDIGHYVRSRWEANVARLMKAANIPYLYEPFSIKLDNDGLPIRYTPDFILEDTNSLIEVKGWWDEKSKTRKALLHKQYPNLDILYIDESIYLDLEKTYSEVILGWEGRE